MIAARQIAFGKAAGWRKPYDAEIEYLRGDGKSFIEVPCFVSKNPLNTPTIGVKFINLCTSVISPVFMVFYGSRQYIVARNGSSKMFMVQFGNATPFYERTINFEKEHTLEISPSTGKVIEDGVSYDIGTNLLNQDSDKIVLFARYNTFSGTVDGISNVTIYWMKIYSPDKTELLFDLIPVRKGNIGYMYDRVSGQLFGNQGTGEFVLGPDVNRNEDAFILVSPTQTAIHYPPIVTTDTFSPDEDFRIELRYKCLLNGLGSWGTILGTTGSSKNTGINLRQRDTTNEAYLLVGGINSQFFDCSNWVDLSFSPSEGLVVNGTIFLKPALIDMSKFTSTNPLYIGEGPRGYGATCASAWKYVRIYRNGVMTRNYIPHVSGSFIDTVSGNILEVNSKSTTMVEYYES